jgi:hypothetical protein
VEQGVEQALLQQPGLGPQEPLGGGEGVIHGFSLEIRRPGRLERIGRPPSDI